jgi:hypothetical protein
MCCWLVAVLVLVTTSMAATHIYREEPPRVTSSRN